MCLAAACLILLLLGACSTEAPPADRLAGRDVPCLRHQVYELGASFTNAVAACGVLKPDLTGSRGLQQVALDAKVPFTIRPHADAYLKQRQAELVTGHLIPYANAGATYNPRNGIFPTIITPSGF